MKPWKDLVVKLGLVIFLAAGVSPLIAAQYTNDDIKVKLSDGLSLAPMLGYDPTYGVIVGGSLFRGQVSVPANYLRVSVFGSLSNTYELQGQFTLWGQDRTFYDMAFKATTFYSPYFGEGNQTNPEEMDKLENQKFLFAPSLWYRWTRYLSFGIVSEFQYRVETGVSGESNLRIFGNELTPVFGVAARYDGRDHQVAPTRGEFVQLRVDFGPSLLSSRSGAANFVRGQADVRYFYPLMEKMVLASQIKIAAALGEPGFLYRFSLGGSDLLRGYQRNRLRGRLLYLGQLELRYQMTRSIGAVAFSGLGSVGDKYLVHLGMPKLTGGGGIRVGLPPDYVAKLRLDFGISEDEKAFYFNFNEAF